MHYHRYSFQYNFSFMGIHKHVQTDFRKQVGFSSNFNKAKKYAIKANRSNSSLLLPQFLCFFIRLPGVWHDSTESNFASSNTKPNEFACGKKHCRVIAFVPLSCHAFPWKNTSIVPSLRSNYHLIRLSTVFFVTTKVFDNFQRLRKIIE